MSQLGVKGRVAFGGSAIETAPKSIPRFIISGSLGERSSIEEPRRRILWVQLAVSFSQGGRKMAAMMI
jgi:hypothetical protein